MPKVVSSTEAQNRFASMMQWANEHNDGVVVEVRGEPRAAILSYADYAEFLRLRKQEQKRKVLAALDAIREEIKQKGPPLTTEEAYHLAGISEDVIQKIAQHDDTV